MFVAVRAELFKLYSAGIITAIFGGCVARNAGRALVDVGATLGAFEGDDNADAFSHFFA